MSNLAWVMFHVVSNSGQLNGRSPLRVMACPTSFSNKYGTITLTISKCIGCPWISYGLVLSQILPFCWLRRWYSFIQKWVSALNIIVRWKFGSAQNCIISTCCFRPFYTIIQALSILTKNFPLSNFNEWKFIMSGLYYSEKVPLTIYSPIVI